MIERWDTRIVSQSNGSKFDEKQENVGDVQHIPGERKDTGEGDGDK